MAFESPGLSILRQRIASDIERHSHQKASSRGDIYFPLSQALAGAAHSLHGHLAYNEAQIFDKSCDDQNLLRRAAEIGIFQIPAVRAQGSATVKGNLGAVITAGELLQDDQQNIYSVKTDITLTSGTAIIELLAQSIGIDGNLTANTQLGFLNTILELESNAAVIEMSGGADVETIKRVRSRLDERRKHPPMGGNRYDYESWATQAHVDITRAWCVPNGLGIGTVLVRFVTDNLASAIPTQAHVDAVQSYIDTVRPAGMKNFIAIAPIAKDLNFSFTRLQPDTPAVRAAINAELLDLIRREGKPGVTLYLSQINEAVSLATGERDHRIDLTDDVVCAAGEFPVLGSIT